MKFNKSLIIKWISAVIALVAIAVMIGYFFDIPFLRTIFPGIIAMRFLTALAFIGCAVLLFFIVKAEEEEEEEERESVVSLLFILGASLFIFLLMMITLLNVLGVNFNMEEMINYNFVDHAKTFPATIPSLLTIFNFVLIGAAGLLNLFCIHCRKRINKLAGIIVGIIGLCVFLGFILGIPEMTFAFPGISKAMAFPTSILFMLIGASFFMLSERKTSGKTFSTKYTIKQKMLIGFTIILALAAIMAVSTSITIRENNINLQSLKNVEAPLEVMVEQVIGYDAMLTGYVHWATLDVFNGEYDEIGERKESYDEVGAKLDNLLKYEAHTLLEKSLRGIEDKEVVYGYLDRLDEVNLKLVDLELGAFAALEKNDTKTALKLTCEGDYYTYKDELKVIYQNWANEEARISNLFKQKNLNNLKYIFMINLYFGLLIIIAGIITALSITNSVVKPLRRLEDSANEISSGNIDVKIPSDLKSMPGIIGHLAYAYDKLIRSSHEALENLVKAKVLGKETNLEILQNKYKSLYDNSTDALMTLEPPSWNFTAGNPAAIKMFRCKNEKEFISMPPWKLSPKFQPDGQPSSIKARKMIEKAMKNGSNLFNWVHKRKNGEDFEATVRLSRIKISDKFVLEALVRDLTTERKLLK